MRDWDEDGWTTRDWDNITEDADGLRAIASEFANAVNEGGGKGFAPSELVEFAGRLQMMANRLYRINAGYYAAQNADDPSSDYGMEQRYENGY